ncbi:MAG: hypothetical protein R2748_14165 [Bryobacterales bacterium]
MVWLFAGLALAATGYSAAVLEACRRFRRRRASQAVPARRPGISILKPVRGLDAQFDQNLRAHQGQDYPDFEILLGLADEDDPAVEVAYRLGIEPVICGETDASTRKVAILELLAAAGSP